MGEEIYAYEYEMHDEVRQDPLQIRAMKSMEYLERKHNTANLMSGELLVKKIKVFSCT